MMKIASTISTEERISMVINDLMAQCAEAREKCIERSNYEKASRRDAQVEILEELMEKLAARGIVCLDDPVCPAK